LAQCGEKHRNAKPLKGFGGASVQEIVLDVGGDAYRVVYSIGNRGAVHVLHAFKSKRAKATPAHEFVTIKRRLRAVREHEK
jgi:phage-related protein